MSKVKFKYFIDGKLQKSSSVSMERGRKWLENVQNEWSSTLGITGYNHASKVTKVSDNEVEVVTTENNYLRWVLA